MCVRGESDVWSGGVPAANIRSWTGGHGKHSEDIIVSSTAGLSVGLMVVLDQRDDASDTRGVFVCASLACSQEGKPAGRPGRGGGASRRAPRSSRAMSSTGAGGFEAQAVNSRARAGSARQS